MSTVTIKDDIFSREVIPVDELNYKKECHNENPQLNLVLKFIDISLIS